MATSRAMAHMVRRAPAAASAGAPRSRGPRPAAGRWRAEARVPHLPGPPQPRQDVQPAKRAAGAFGADRRRTTGIPHLWDEARVSQRVCAVRSRLRERWGPKPARAFAQPPLRA
jgi:hypothetical protein